jgi:TetR/AcrR family transcriptional regulator, transcriptional repressor for nem operon
LHEPDEPVRELLAANFRVWVAAVEEQLRAAPERFPEDTNFSGLAELALSVMEGGVMQARTFRDVAHFDRAIAQFRAHVEALIERARTRGVTQ